LQRPEPFNPIRHYTTEHVREQNVCGRAGVRISSDTSFSAGFEFRRNVTMPRRVARQCQNRCCVPCCVDCAIDQLEIICPNLNSLRPTFLRVSVASFSLARTCEPASPPPLGMRPDTMRETGPDGCMRLFNADHGALDDLLALVTRREAQLRQARTELEQWMRRNRSTA